MIYSEEFLRDAQSQVLRLQKEIEGGRARSDVKQEFYARYEAQDAKPLVDFLLTLEAVFGERPEMSEKTRVIITNANIANLNLGEQTGLINATVNVLASQGESGKAMAEALRTLTAGIESAQDLTLEQKKEALESVEIMAEQAKLPVEKRKPGAFNAAIGHLPTLLSAAAATIKIWEAVAPLIKAYFAAHRFAA